MSRCGLTPRCCGSEPPRRPTSSPIGLKLGNASTRRQRELRRTPAELSPRAFVMLARSSCSLPRFHVLDSPCTPAPLRDRGVHTRREPSCLLAGTSSELPTTRESRVWWLSCFRCPARPSLVRCLSVCRVRSALFARMHPALRLPCCLHRERNTMLPCFHGKGYFTPETAPSWKEKIHHPLSIFHHGCPSSFSSSRVV